MDPNFVVLLYSKYSQTCKNLISTLQEKPISYLQPLCIDNSQVRKRITESKDLSIESVPCVLISFSNGTVEKYDGQHAFKWIQETLQRLYPPEPQLPSSGKSPQQPQQQPQQSQQPQQPQPSSTAEGSGGSDLQNHVQRQMQQRQELQSMQKNKANPSQATSIDNLTLTESGDQQPNLGHHIPQPDPPGSLPTSVDAAFRPDGSGDTGKAIKPSGSGNSSMAKAEQMQRMREQNEAPIAKNRGIPPQPPS